MNILVLGSAGRIGRSLTKHLRKSWYKVIEFDIASYDSQDLRVPEVLDKILPTVDFVFFLAFDVGGSKYLKAYQDSYDFISNNMRIMASTFDSLKKYGTPFIFASSQMAGMTSTYGLLKHIGEKYTTALNGKTAKLWNVYSHESASERSLVITDFISMARINNRIDMRTSGEEKRQFLHVDDCCRCLCVMMEDFYIIKQGSLDVSSFEWHSIVDVAKIIASHFKNCSIHQGSEVDDVQRGTLNEPGQEILEYWQPKISLEAGIKNIILS
jgi:nucleoside-diphosphate-sugar epimerase